MLRTIFTSWTRSARYKTRPVRNVANDADVTDRQRLAPNFDQAKLRTATINCIGAGGLGSEVGYGFVRKGVGLLRVFDRDSVEPSNLNRQLFFQRDCGHRKGVCLARNLAPHATCGTIIEGYPLHFQDACALGIDLTADVSVCGIDNDHDRWEIAQYFGSRGMPVVFLAVDLVAEHGYVFVQEPGKACFGCVFPNALNNPPAPCRSAAVVDINKVVAGLALYAADSLLMGRPRNWNYRNVHIAGFAPGDEFIIDRKQGCPLCASWYQTAQQADRGQP